MSILDASNFRASQTGGMESILQKSGAKTIFYNNNGGGRDTYISNNNGGFCIDREAHKAGQIGTFTIQKKPPRAFRPVIHSKGIHYHSDGTGRDSYIETSSGGLNSSYSPGSHNKTFFNTLRSYQRIDYSPTSTRRQNSGSPRNNDVFTASQGFFSVKYHQQMKMFKNYQKMQTLRLAKPKFDSPINRGRKNLATIQNNNERKNQATRKAGLNISRQISKAVSAELESKHA